MKCRWELRKISLSNRLDNHKFKLASQIVSKRNTHWSCLLVLRWVNRLRKVLVKRRLGKALFSSSALSFYGQMNDWLSNIRLGTWRSVSGRSPLSESWVQDVQPLWPEHRWTNGASKSRSLCSSWSLTLSVKGDVCWWNCEIRACHVDSSYQFNLYSVFFLQELNEPFASLFFGQLDLTLFRSQRLDIHQHEVWTGPSGR